MGCYRPTEIPKPPPPQAQQSNKVDEGDLLKNGLAGWTVYTGNEFQKPGKVEFRNDTLSISAGDPYGGVSLASDFMKDHYEVSLQARRTGGNDIFCGILFPVGKDYCSMVLGGWGNSLSGLSMINGLFASENETAYPESFTNHVWVDVTLRVSPDAIRVFTGTNEIISQEREDRLIEPYPGLEVFEPFGFFTYETDAEIRRVRVRELPAETPDY
jgi:hypothetical protein